MKRRQFLAASVITASGLGSGASWAEAGQHVDFTQEAYQEALKSGKPFLLDFSASW